MIVGFDIGMRFSGGLLYHSTCNERTTNRPIDFIKVPQCYHTIYAKNAH